MSYNNVSWLFKLKCVYTPVFGIIPRKVQLPSYKKNILTASCINYVDHQPRHKSFFLLFTFSPFEIIISEKKPWGHGGVDHKFNHYRYCNANMPPFLIFVLSFIFVVISTSIKILSFYRYCHAFRQPSQICLNTSNFLYQFLKEKSVASDNKL